MFVVLCEYGSLKRIFGAMLTTESDSSTFGTIIPEARETWSRKASRTNFPSMKQRQLRFLSVTRIHIPLACKMNMVEKIDRNTCISAHSAPNKSDRSLWLVLIGIDEWDVVNIQTRIDWSATFNMPLHRQSGSLENCRTQTVCRKDQWGNSHRWVLECTRQRTASWPQAGINNGRI